MGGACQLPAYRVPAEGGPESPETPRLYVMVRWGPCAEGCALWRAGRGRQLSAALSLRRPWSVVARRQARVCARDAWAGGSYVSRGWLCAGGGLPSCSAGRGRLCAWGAAPAGSRALRLASRADLGLQASAARRARLRPAPCPSSGWRRVQAQASGQRRPRLRPAPCAG